MTTLVLGRNGIMSNEGDGNAWATIVGLGSGIVGLLSGLFFKGVGYAASRGRSDGVIDAQIAALSLRMTAMEAREDRRDHRLDDMATKEDMRNGFSELKDQVRDLQNVVNGRTFRSPTA